MATSDLTGTRAGEGLVGQAAVSRRSIRVGADPSGALALRSGLLDATPRDLVVLPVLFEGEMLGVRQSGMQAFKFARLPEDVELLERARRHAWPSR